MEQIIKDVRAFREKMLADKYRPGYHFAIPDDIGMPGDPNGCFYANGVYHLMYLYENRCDSFRWGHMTSVDLVHWRHLPDAIFPTETLGACFSGGAFVDEDGTAYISYWRLPGKEESIKSGIGIASSKGPDYEKWDIWEDISIASTEWGLTEIEVNGEKICVGSSDPSNIWKANGYYYIQTGNLPILNKYGREENSLEEFKGDWVDLFRSKDLKTWEFRGRFYQRRTDNTWTDETEDDMCPSFLPLATSSEGGAFSGKYLQLFIAHNKGCQYYIGEYDVEKERFYPEKHGRMSWKDNTYFAPEALVDDKGRQIMWAWLLDNAGEMEDWKREGWTGVYGLPRNLWLGEDGTLRMLPVEELKALRYNECDWGTIKLSGNAHALEGVNGESCELCLKIKADGKNPGVFVRRNPDCTEYTHIYYDKERRVLVMDTTKCGTAGRPLVEEAPFELKDGEILHLRIWIDKSVIEVYANERQAICRRVYPVNDDSTGIYVDGTSEVTAKGCSMFPANPY